MLTHLFPSFFYKTSFGTSFLFEECLNSLLCLPLYTTFPEIYSHAFIFAVLSPHWDYVNQIQSAKLLIAELMCFFVCMYLPCQIPWPMCVTNS